MKFKTLLLVCAFSVSSSLALADTFTFTANGPGITGSGTIFATPSSTAGVDDVTSISGQFNGFLITGLIPGSYNASHPTFLTYFTSGGTKYGADFDNLLYTSGIPLDNGGIEITLSNGADANIYSSSGTVYYSDSTIFTTPAGLSDLGLPLTFTVAPVPVPEPSSFALLSSGALALIGAARRRRRA